MTEQEQAIRSIVYNDENIVNVIKEAPQTYNTLLKSMKDNGTFQCVLRRRIKRLVNQQQIWKLRIPGTRFGLVVFCTPEHDYKILSLNPVGFKTVKVFYFFDFEETDTEIILENYWQLAGPNWSKWEYCSEPKKIEKYKLRDGGFTFWQ